MGQVILVTGATSGIGQATATRLQKAGHTVWGSARKSADLDALTATGVKPIPLDVADEASRLAAVRAIEAEHGAIDVLVNNAGYSQSGPVEEIPLDQWRRQFETNVFGLVRMCQLVLPKMREQKRGRIINIGSMGGTLTFPGGGAYHASKYAVEAVSDALRFEVAGFGVQVVLVQPGIIRTRFAETAVGGIGQTEGPYAGFTAAVAKSTHDVYEKGPLMRLGGEPDDVAKVIERAIDAARPRARYTVTWSATVMMTQRAWSPD
jgi:NAD(P)-dependent dehydrogenase (short-subunit alcohol dehydrogenase family)